MTDGTRSGWRLTGQLREPIWPTPRLIVLDGAARVVGVGLGGLDARAVEELGTSSGVAPDRWLGEIEAIDPQAVQAYAVNRRNHALCSLNKVKLERSMTKPSRDGPATSGLSSGSVRD